MSNISGISGSGNPQQNPDIDPPSSVHVSDQVQLIQKQDVAYKFLQQQLVSSLVAQTITLRKKG